MGNANGFDNILNRGLPRKAVRDVLFSEFFLQKIIQFFIKPDVNGFLQFPGFLSIPDFDIYKDNK